MVCTLTGIVKAQESSIAMQEVDAFGRDRLPQNSDLEKLPYVQAAFKEALRLFPPGHISIREALEDLNLNGFSVEKGTWLHVSSTCSFFLHGLSVFFSRNSANSIVIEMHRNSCQKYSRI